MTQLEFGQVIGAQVVLLAGGMPWGVLLPFFMLGVALGVWRGRDRAA